MAAEFAVRSAEWHAVVHHPARPGCVELQRNASFLMHSGARELFTRRAVRLMRPVAPQPIWQSSCSTIEPKAFAAWTAPEGLIRRREVDFPLRTESIRAVLGVSSIHPYNWPPCGTPFALASPDVCWRARLDAVNNAAKEEIGSDWAVEHEAVLPVWPTAILWSARQAASVEPDTDHVARWTPSLPGVPVRSWGNWAIAEGSQSKGVRPGLRGPRMRTPGIRVVVVRTRPHSECPAT